MCVSVCVWRCYVRMCVAMLVSCVSWRVACCDISKYRNPSDVKFETPSCSVRSCHKTSERRLIHMCVCGDVTCVCVLQYGVCERGDVSCVCLAV